MVLEERKPILVRGTIGKMDNIENIELYNSMLWDIISEMYESGVNAETIKHVLQNAISRLDIMNYARDWLSKNR